MFSSTANAKPTVIYDGDCPFCIQRINNLKALDKADKLSYLPRQDSKAEADFPQITNIPLDDGILFVKPGDKHVYVAADAIYEIARRLPTLNLVAWIYLVPGFRQVIQLGYRFIAVNRRRLGHFCQNGQCKTR